MVVVVVVVEEAEVEEEGRATSRAGHWTAMEDRRASRVAVRGRDTCASSSAGGCYGGVFGRGRGIEFEKSSQSW